jgi:hypothetical protein
MTTKPLRETELYAPVKSLLQAQGYEVKGEVGAVDIMAVRGDEDPVIVELKTGFSLSLFHQAIERQSITDAVYIAVPRSKGRAFGAALKRNIALCRRLGLGLITVRLKDGFSEIHLDPAPYKPRQVVKRKTRLLREFARLTGDPNPGGSSRRQGLVTAYRQDALRCLQVLSGEDSLKASVVAGQAQVPRAREIMAANHYGWFERIERGIYALSPKGHQALADYSQALQAITAQVLAASDPTAAPRPSEPSQPSTLVK